MLSDEGIQWKQLAEVNAKSMRYISKDVRNIASRLEKTPFSDNFIDKYKSNVVESSFFISAFNIAAKAFNEMVAEAQEKDAKPKSMGRYFRDQIDMLVDIEDSREKGVENDNEN